MTVEEAIRIAASAHEDVLDKGGVPYICHPLAVMDDYIATYDFDEDGAVIAVLHDVIEDTACYLSTGRPVTYLAVPPITSKLLGQGMFPLTDTQATGLDAITKREGEVYLHEYIPRLSEHPKARRVKLCDLKHNTLPRRVAALPEEERGIARRYSRAAAYLDAVEYGTTLPSGRL